MVFKKKKHLDFRTLLIFSTFEMFSKFFKIVSNPCGNQNLRLEYLANENKTVRSNTSPLKVI